MMKFKNKQEQYEWWTDTITKIQNHGTSIRAGCREVGVQFWQYYDWKERVQEFVDRKKVTLSDTEAVRVPRGRQKQSLSFLEVVNTVETPGEYLSLHYNDSWRLDIPEDFNPSTLSSVLQTLKSL